MQAERWLATLDAARRAGEPCVMVTVAETKGSAPREAGAKMIVFADRQVGTIGGGTLELTAAEMARRALKDGTEEPRLEPLPLGPALGQCCGGHVTLLLEPVLPVAATLLLFGAGHVGRELVSVLDGLPIAIRWIDGRANEMPDRVPDHVVKRVTDTPLIDVENAPVGALYLIMTHDHALDLELVEAVLRRGDAGWIGLIGSASKRARFSRQLEARGLSMAGVTSPIGVPGIRSKHPRAIAVSTGAQLLSVIEERVAASGDPAKAPAG